MTTLVLDNISPFTPNIISCLKKIGVPYIYRKFFELEIDKIKYDKVILSGRQKNNKQMNIINSKIIRHCFETGKSLLGICYGAEILALTMGGSIYKMASPISDKIAVTVLKPNQLVAKQKEIIVFESHKYSVARLPDRFDSIASSSMCKHEIFCHINKNIFGTQFHPEKSGQIGLEILSNFLMI